MSFLHRRIPGAALIFGGASLALFLLLIAFLSTVGIEPFEWYGWPSLSWESAPTLNDTPVQLSFTVSTCPMNAHLGGHVYYTISGDVGATKDGVFRHHFRGREEILGAAFSDSTHLRLHVDRNRNGDPFDDPMENRFGYQGEIHENRSSYDGKTSRYTSWNAVQLGGTDGIQYEIRADWSTDSPGPDRLGCYPDFVWRSPVFLNGKKREIVVIDRYLDGAISDSDPWFISEAGDPPIKQLEHLDYRTLSSPFPAGYREVRLELRPDSTVWCHLVSKEEMYGGYYADTTPAIADAEAELRRALLRNADDLASIAAAEIAPDRPTAVDLDLRRGRFAAARILDEIKEGWKAGTSLKAAEALRSAEDGDDAFVLRWLVIVDALEGHDTASLAPTRDLLFAMKSGDDLDFSLLFAVGRRLQFTAGDLEGAIRCYRRARALIKDGEHPQGTGELGYLLAVALIERGETREARQILDELARLSTYQIAATMRLVRLDLADGAIDSARRRIEAIPLRQSRYVNHMLWQMRREIADRAALQ